MSTGSPGKDPAYDHAVAARWGWLRGPGAELLVTDWGVWPGSTPAFSWWSSLAGSRRPPSRSLGAPAPRSPPRWSPGSEDTTTSGRNHAGQQHFNTAHRRRGRLQDHRASEP